MSDQQKDQSVALFFDSFAKHLTRIRDDGTDANQAYRAQILLGQLQLFEKAVQEYGGGMQQAVGEASGLESLLVVDSVESLAVWALEKQSFVPVKALFFLNLRGEWESLGGESTFPESLKIADWIKRGQLARVVGPPADYTAFLYGQPRLLMRFDEHEAHMERASSLALFLAQQLPLLITSSVKEHTEAAAAKLGMIATDPAFLDTLAMIERAATKDVTILLEGESGTGKEVIADFVHRNSPRAKKKLVAVNCAAIPAGLIESELFGHEKGSFTGAYNRQMGRVEEANGGTLFLDEIGEMELSMQAKLLRFLQSHTFHRVGGKQKISVDVRIIAATNRNLKQRVAANEFREDLYYRLSVMPFAIPPLRDRVGDIVPLCKFFLKKYAREFGTEAPDVDEMVYQLLAGYEFPGNVRELENLIQNILVVSHGAKILATHLPPNIQKAEPKGVPMTTSGGEIRTWGRRKGFGTKIKLPADFFKKKTTAAATEVWGPHIPQNNEELKETKQRIQDYASELTLDLERKFLKDLLERAENSMPKASKLGNINRTLLYKMIDRTKSV